MSFHLQLLFNFNSSSKWKSSLNPFFSKLARRTRSSQSICTCFLYDMFFLIFTIFFIFQTPYSPKSSGFSLMQNKTPLILTLSLNALCTMGDFRERTRTGNVYFMPWNQRDFPVANWSSKICTCSWVLRALLLSNTSNVQCLDEKLTCDNMQRFSSPFFPVPSSTPATLFTSLKENEGKIHHVMNLLTIGKDFDSNGKYDPTIWTHLG